MTILDEIVDTKRREVAEAKRRRPVERLRAEIDAAPPPRDFFAAVTAASGCGVWLIAEIKKASPSAGLLVQDFDPASMARVYADHGAAALSVLTDETYFQGRLADIGTVRAAVELPVLRKDFMVDPYQIDEARAAGADAVLLIAEVLSPSQVSEFMAQAQSLGMTVLVEVHGEETLAAVLDGAGPPGRGRYLLGINNRDLSAQRTDLSTTTRLAALLPGGTPFVAESGISTRADVLEVERAGACAILVGESLLRADDMAAQIRKLLGH